MEGRAVSLEPNMRGVASPPFAKVVGSIPVSLLSAKRTSRLLVHDRVSDVAPERVAYHFKLGQEVKMASVESINETLDRIVAPTPHDKGLKITIELTVYDNGLVSMDGRALTDQNRDAMIPGGSVEAWNAAHEVFAIKMEQ
jgi:hypothetical protein